MIVVGVMACLQARQVVVVAVVVVGLPFFRHSSVFKKEGKHRRVMQ
ncbi:MAG: hypothetical protein JXR41_07205 [Bacteroidales bacterium]|nr:hypothetical protein [Bacteroidales bacterium]MBN2762859.1 hypothetical protein [Bacteroidales bacterium]